jgi:hypothetical protein
VRKQAHVRSAESCKKVATRSIWRQRRQRTNRHVLSSVASLHGSTLSPLSTIRDEDWRRSVILHGTIDPSLPRTQLGGGGGLNPIYVYFFAWPDGSHQISSAPRHQRSSSPSVLAPDQQPRPPFFAPAGEDHCSRRAGASSPPPIQIDK